MRNGKSRMRVDVLVGASWPAEEGIASISSFSVLMRARLS